MQGAESNPKIRLVNAAIKVYTNIFCNARLSQKNRLQLCKHLQAHLVQNEESVNKQFTIIVLCYSIARHLSKTPGVCDTMEEVEHIFTLLQSMGEFACIVPSHSLRVLGCELLALLHRAFSESLSSALSNLAADLEKLGDATDVLSRSKAALVAGYLFKHFDSDKLFFFIKPIVRVIMKQLNNLNALSKFYGFFAVYLALKYTGGMFIDSFKECLILCLDNYNADIRLDKALFSTLSRIFELVIRIDPSFDQGKLPIVAFDALEMSRCNHPLVSLSILQFTKYNLLAASSVITLEQSIELALRGVRNVGASMLNRKLSLEILGIVVYQGNYKALHKADPALIWTLLEELNTIKGGEPGVSYAYGAKQVKKLLELSTWDLDLEKSLGLSERLKHDSMQTRFSELLKKNEVLVYQYTLKQLVIYVLMKIAEQKGEINNIVNMVKHILSYRIQSDEGLEEAKAHAADNKEGIVTKEVAKDDSYKFSKNIRMGTKSFVIKLLRKLILNETRESELVLLMNQFPNILSLSFSFINIEANPKKQAAFTLIKSSIKQCRNVKDTVVPLNDEEETTELHNGLEQYEAQINALIRQYATKSSSYDALESVFGIFYYLCSIPISRDYGTLAKLMGQLAEPLKSMSLAGSVEFSCEKDALKCHFKRLKVLCRLYFVGMKAQFTSHAKSKGEESKFLTEEDRKGILKLFTPEIEGHMAKHIMAALSDCWFILTQNKKVARQKTNYMLIHSGVPSAFSVKSCQSSVLCFLKYLSLCSDKPSTQTLLRENISTVIPFILYYLAKKPELTDSGHSQHETVSAKLAESFLHKNDLLLSFALLVKHLGPLDIPEELAVTSLDLMQKLIDTKIIEFSTRIMEVVKELCEKLMSQPERPQRKKILLACEEILGKVWLQSVNPQTAEETKMFVQMYNCWKTILLHYARNADCEPQFQTTFNTLATNLASLIPSAKINNAKVYAKLCITTLKELFSISPLESFVKSEAGQFLQSVSSLLQTTEAGADRTEVLFIAAMNSALSLADCCADELPKAFSDFLEVFDVVRIQPSTLKAAAAVVKSAPGVKGNRLVPMVLEHVIQQLYKGIEGGECANVGQKLQLATTLYQTIGVDSESFFRMLFALHLGFCSGAFSNAVLKEALNSMNGMLAVSPAHFKAAVAKLSPKEVKYLQLLMKLNASNKIA